MHRRSVTKIWFGTVPSLLLSLLYVGLGAGCESHGLLLSFVASGRAASAGSKDLPILASATQSSVPLDIYDGEEGKETSDRDDATHTRFMRLALELAERAKRKGEVPVGAVVVQRHLGEDGTGERYEILSRAYNMVETRHDASAHAELLALRRAAQRVGNWRLTNTTLYSTLEPCPMCLAAAQAFRVSSIVYGAPDLRLGAVETHMRLLDDYEHPYHNIGDVVPGVMSDESATLLKSFFRDRRTGTSKSPRSERGGRRRKLRAMLSGLVQAIFRRQR